MEKPEYPYPNLVVDRAMNIGGEAGPWHLKEKGESRVKCGQKQRTTRSESKTNLTQEALFELIGQNMCHDCWEIYFEDEAIEYICHWDESQESLVDKILGLLG